jgi:hypothetical protein
MNPVRATASVVIDSREDSGRRFKACCAGMFWLLLVAVLVFIAVACFSFSRHGNVGVLAAAVASFICFASAAAALFVTGMVTGTPNALTGSLLGILLRTMVPFFVCILLVQTSRPLADAGLFGMVLVNYFVVLAVETVLAVRIVQAHSSTVVQQ